MSHLKLPNAFMLGLKPLLLNPIPRPPRHKNTSRGNSNR
jgi:hypothetical protein